MKFPNPNGNINNNGKRKILRIRLHSHNKILTCHFIFVILFNIRTFYLCTEQMCKHLAVAVYAAKHWPFRCVYTLSFNFNPVHKKNHVKRTFHSSVYLLQGVVCLLVLGRVRARPIPSLFLCLFLLFFSLSIHSDVLTGCGALSMRICLFPFSSVNGVHEACTN